MLAILDAVEAIAGAGKATLTITKSSPIYIIPLENLESIWTEFRKRAESDIIQMFKNAFLVTNTKGFKMLY